MQKGSVGKRRSGSRSSHFLFRLSSLSPHTVASADSMQHSARTMRIPSRLAARSLATTTPPSSSSYAPPLAPGVLPAYDQALLYLSSDKSVKLEKLEKLQAVAKGAAAEEGQAEAWEKRKEMERLEVDAWVNDPETRWKSERGLGESLPRSSAAGAEDCARRWTKCEETSWRGAIVRQRATAARTGGSNGLRTS